MDFALCVNDSYAPYAMVTIRSILDNNSPSKCKFHVLTNDMTLCTRNSLKELCIDSYIEIVEVDDSELQQLYSGHWQVYTWYRILLPQILKGVSKVLYLDADVIVDDNLENLFAIDMSGISVMGAPDIDTMSKKTYERCGYPDYKGYICAGVLMMNLDYWREFDLYNKLIQIALKKKEKFEYPDQDAINYVCQDSKIILPLKYGVVYYYLSRSYFKERMPEECIEMIEHPAIIHYAGVVPWVKEKDKHFFSYKWHLYNSRLISPVRITRINTGMKYYLHKLKILLHKLGLSSYNPWYVATRLINLDKERGELYKQLSIRN